MVRSLRTKGTALARRPLARQPFSLDLNRSPSLQKRQAHFLNRIAQKLMARFPHKLKDRETGARLHGRRKPMLGAGGRLFSVRAYIERSGSESLWSLIPRK